MSKLREAPLMASKEARPAGDCEVERAERPFSCGTRAARPASWALRSAWLGAAAAGTAAGRVTAGVAGAAGRVTAGAAFRVTAVAGAAFRVTVGVWGKRQ